MAINAVSATLDKNLLSNDIYSTAASDYLHVPVVPADVQALFDLPAYSASVTQNGATQTPHVFRSINHEFGEDAFKDDYYQQDNHWIKISAIGRVSFSLTLTGQNYVNPKIISRYDDITPLYSGNTATFNIDKPGYYAFLPDEGVTTTKSVTGMGGLNANGDAISGSITKTTHQRPFFIFIMPPETNIPDPADVTYYYGPGVHNIGQETSDDGNGNVTTHAGGIQLVDGDTVYIHESAAVTGCFYTDAANLSNTKIYGRGLITGRGLSVTAAELAVWGNHLVFIGHSSKGNGGLNNLLEGITMVDGIRGSAVGYNALSSKGCQYMSWEHRQDGITIGADSEVYDNFFKTRDDSLKLFNSRVTGDRNVFWAMSSGSSGKMSWHGRTTVENVRLKNTTILQQDVFTDYKGPNIEPDRGDLSSTNGLISGMGLYSGAYIRKIIFDGLVCKDPDLSRVMGLRCTTVNTATDGSLTMYGEDEGSRGYQDILVHGLELADHPHKPSFVYANNGADISNIKFENFKVGGVVQTSRAATQSKIDGEGFILEASAKSGVTNLWADPVPLLNTWTHSGGSYTSTTDTYTSLGYHTVSDSTIGEGNYKINFTVANGQVRIKVRNSEGTANEVLGTFAAGTHELVFEVYSGRQGVMFDDGGNIGVVVSDITLQAVTVTTTDHWTDPPPEAGLAWTDNGDGSYSKNATNWHQLGFATADDPNLGAGNYELIFTVTAGPVRVYTRNNSDDADTQIGEYADGTHTVAVPVAVRGVAFAINNDTATISNISLTATTTENTLTAEGPVGTVSNIQVVPAIVEIV